MASGPAQSLRDATQEPADRLARKRSAPARSSNCDSEGMRLRWVEMALWNVPDLLPNRIQEPGCEKGGSLGVVGVEIGPLAPVKAALCPEPLVSFAA